MSLPVALVLCIGGFSSCALPDNAAAGASAVPLDNTLSEPGDDVPNEEETPPLLETVAAPAFTPDAGYFTSPQTVCIACATTGALVYYTTDGSVPTPASAVYTGAVALTGTMTLKALALKAGMNASGITEATYVMDDETPVVHLSGLAEGAIIIGSCSVTADAQDNGEFDSLSLYINEVKIDETSALSMSYDWLTSVAENGSYTVKAQARDRMGNTAVDTVSVTVMNGSGDGEPLEYEDPGFDSGPVRSVQLFVDSNNVPWAAYVSDGGADIGRGMLVKYAPSGWEPVDVGGFCASGETIPSPGVLRIVVKDGEPFVLYRNNSGVIRIVHWNGTSWSQAGDDFGSVDYGDFVLDKATGDMYVAVNGTRDGDFNVSLYKYDGDSWEGMCGYPFTYPGNVFPVRLYVNTKEGSTSIKLSVYETNTPTPKLLILSYGNGVISELTSMGLYNAAYHWGCVNPTDNELFIIWRKTASEKKYISYTKISGSYWMSFPNPQAETPIDDAGLTEDNETSSGTTVGMKSSAGEGLSDILIEGGILFTCFRAQTDSKYYLYSSSLATPDFTLLDAIPASSMSLFEQGGFMYAAYADTADGGELKVKRWD